MAASREMVDFDETLEDEKTSGSGSESESGEEEDGVAASLPIVGDDNARCRMQSSSIASTEQSGKDDASHHQTREPTPPPPPSHHQVREPTPPLPSTKKFTKENNTPAASIEKALNANRRLQTGLLSRIQNVSRLKKTNREMCAQIVLAMDRCYSERDMLGIDKTTAGSPLDLDCNQTSSLLPSASSLASKGAKKRKKPPSHIIRTWSYNENRKWTKRFFVDPDKNIPEPNADILRRREWEGDMISMDKDRFQSWSTNESNTLKICAEKVRKQQNEGNNTPIKDAEIDYHQVTQLVQEQLSAQKVSSRQEKKKYHRAVCDYRIKFLTDLSPSINKGPFTKEESLKIIELLHEHNDHPRWDIVARILNTNRTPFQCFTYAQSKLATTSISSSSMTLQCNPTAYSQFDDELMLKFIAASGPQTVINNHVVSFLSERFFPHLDKKQILNRCHTSLINPNFDHRKWNDKEERLLVLGMRLYCESDSAINKVAVSWYYEYIFLRRTYFVMDYCFTIVHT